MSSRATKNVLSPEKEKSPPKKAKFCDTPGESMNTDIDTNIATATPGALPACNTGETPPAWFLNYMTNFEKRIHTNISSQISVLSTKVNEQEEKLSANCIQISELEKKVEKLKLTNDHLAQKMDDLENRSRRCNLVLYGVPEADSSDTSAVVNEVLDFVGIDQNSRGIERCHRTPTTTAASREELKQNPRMIHICFDTYKKKESIRRECVSKFKSQEFKNRKLYVSDDYSKKVLQMRKDKKDQRQRLKDEGKNPFFLFPARLAYKDRAGKLHIVA